MVVASLGSKTESPEYDGRFARPFVDIGGRDESGGGGGNYTLGGLNNFSVYKSRLHRRRIARRDETVALREKCFHTRRSHVF